MQHHFVDDGSGVSCDECTLHKANAVHVKAQAAPARRATTGGLRGGATYNPALDGKRLNAQGQRVFNALADGLWWPLAELAKVSQSPEASVSARIRDLRKPEFGPFVIEKRRRDSGSQWEYRLVLPHESAAATG